MAASTHLRAKGQRGLGWMGAGVCQSRKEGSAAAPAELSDRLQIDASKDDEVNRSQGERFNQLAEVGCHVLASLPLRSRRDPAVARGARWARGATPPRAGARRLQGAVGRAARTAT